MALLPSFLIACAAGPSIDPPTDEPEGWIWFSEVEGASPRAGRVDVRTGAVEWIALPPPFAADPRYSFHEGLVSPLDGSLTGDARFVGGSAFPETFVRDGSTGAVTVYRDALGGPTALALDNGHAWAPDGSAIVFDRHQGQGCCKVFMLLDPVTGTQDTLADFNGQVPDGYGWFGPDTLLWWRAGGPSHYRSYALATGDTAGWDLVPFVDYKMPTVSGDRRWIAHWVDFDSVITGGMPTRVYQLRLLDRLTGTESALVADRFNEGTTPLSETFDPGSEFLAYCSSATTIQVLSLASWEVREEFVVPSCWALGWSRPSVRDN